MEKITLDVKKSEYASAKEARNDGKIPMIYYGKGVEPIQFSVDYQTFRRAYKMAGKSSILTLHTDNKEYDALVHEIQYEPVSDNVMHVDLMAVDKNRTLHTEVPLIFTGVAPAVRELGGTLVVSKDHLAIACLPKDLPHEIEVDITPLVDFHISLTVADIKVPAGVKVVDALDINLVSVSAPRTEEDLTTPPVAGETKVAGEEEKAAAEAKEGDKKAEKK